MANLSTGFLWGFGFAIMNERPWTAMLLFTVGAALPLLWKHKLLP